MAGQNVHPVDFEAGAVFACFSCTRTPARRVRFCPYCGEEQFSPLAEPAADDEKVIHAKFGGERAAPADPAEAKAPAEPSPAPQPASESPAAPAEPPKPKTAETPKPKPFAPPPKPPEPPAPIPVRPRKRGRIWAVAAVIILAIMIFRSLPATKPTPQPDPVVPTVTVYALRGDTGVRDKPSATGTMRLGSLDRGAVVEGSWEDQAGGSRWLKIASGNYAGDYVWGGNLSASPPPALTATVNLDLRTRFVTPVYASPDPASAVLDTIRLRRTAFIAGSLPGGWYEVRLKRGGVGYAAAANFDN